LTLLFFERWHKLNKMRTAKESAEIVEKTITEIRKAKNLTSELISKTCLKYDISESHIRRVAGWKKEALAES
jgi:hypothetical protein